MGHVHGFGGATFVKGMVSRVRALVTSVGLSVLFLVVYSGCNWITARRGDVGLLYFPWEQHIPFVPALIIPYLSIDLFFVAAPFLITGRTELRVFAERIATAIAVAGACFLLFPLRFAFARPAVDGWTGAFFDWFRAMDAPHNLLPSLHAAFCLLLADVYARHLRGALRLVVLSWFVLIGLSPVLTYQHHVLDIVAGFALAAGCFYCFRESEGSAKGLPNVRLGLIYLIGAFVCLVAGCFTWPWGVLLLWPALSLRLVSAAYFRGDAFVFRKENGRIPLSARLILGPCLFGQYLSLLYYKRHARPWDRITPGVWLGRKLNENEAREAIRGGVTAVLDVSAEFSETPAFLDLRYLNVPVLDLTAPSLEQLETMATFIESARNDGKVYVHCKIGYSRSAAAVIAWMSRSGMVNGLEEGISLVRRARPSVVIRPEILEVLTRFAEERTNTAAAPDSFLLASESAVSS